jgi:Ni/Co efflux regulator RcnB
MPFTGTRIAALAIAALLAGAPAAFASDQGEKHEQKAQRKADKHADKDHKRADKAERKAARHRDADVHEGRYFEDRHREHARRYYHEHYVSAGKCPPGLAKKNNGCMPPGQARKWAVGQQLPRDVVVYEVPRPILVQLPPAPVGYRYERVGGDIVLVRVNGRIVVDILLNVFI